MGEAKRRDAKRLPKWTPFQKATFNDVTPSQEEIKQSMQAFNVTEEQVRGIYEDLKNDEVYLNSRYQVNVRRRHYNGGWPELIQLSIKRLDKDRVGPERYRDFLRIKNELVGPEHEAVELYPAMARNVDTANQYYLFVLADADIRLPFGFQDGKMLGPDGRIGKSRQHPFGDD